MVVQGHAPVDFEGINHDQALAVHGLTPLPLREEKFSKRRYGEEKTLVLPMHPFSSGIGGKTIVEANEVTVDSRGSLTIQYEVPKDYPLFRSEWEKVVFGQAGRWSHILGDHAASFKATGVQPDSSLWHRLQGLQWEVSQ